MTELLKQVSIFSSLSEEELEKLASFSKLISYKYGDTLFFDSEPYAGFYIVVKGMVKVYKYSKDGKEHILHIVTPFNTLAEVPLFENAGKIFESDFRYPANCTAIDNDTTVILVRARPFISFIENNAPLAIKMMAGLAKRLRLMSHHLEEIALKDVNKRVASFIHEALKKLSKDNKPVKSFVLPITKTDLASYLGTIPETLSRTFRKFQEDGIIEVEDNTIRLKNITKLEQAME